eukprot:COSAG01_NODE_14466_length_1450_cov_4.282754_3_plen_123_part_01
MLDLSDEEWGRGYVDNKPEDVGNFPRSLIEITNGPSSSPNGGDDADAAADGDDDEGMQTLALAERIRGKGGMYSPPTLHAPAIIAVPGASPVHGPGPVQGDDSSEDDEEAGIYKVKFGADDTG